MQKEDISKTIWDVVVIGGGPAGMMSAGIAGSSGSKVLLLEKNESLGKKLLITGGGRCNITNAELNVRKFLSKFKNSDKFLFSTFSQFSVKESLEFFHGHELETKEEALSRVFPATDSAEDVWKVMIEHLKQNKVVVSSKSEVVELQTKNGRISSVKLKNGEVIQAKSFILATGGKSRPETGSTGEGFDWLKKIGHKVIEPTASLVPLKIKNDWVKKLQGVSLPDVKITVLQNSQKQSVKKGKILFTHFGISGPTILNLSHEIGELLKYGEVILSLDLTPDLDHGQLNQKLQDIFKEKSNKKFKNTLDSIVPSAMSTIIVELSKINGDKQSNSITREERLLLVDLIKNINVGVDSLLGIEKAIITSGGVDLAEVDFKTMSSRIFSNLYLVGDVLNIDRPSGGYSLQLCWTTGYVAGSNA